MQAIDSVLFVILPYVAAVVCVIGTVERYRRHAFSCTSQSTQFLENRLHFWALLPFHAGILAIAVGHLIAFAIPRGVLVWNAVPLRLYVLEGAALAAGILALGGFALAIVRRVFVPAVRRATNWLDWAVYLVLLAEIATGVVVAISYRWGSSWFAAALTPYLWSLVRLQPDAALVGAMPLLVRAHVLGAWVLVAFFPFSRLVHIVSVPNAYLWRPPQVVRWNSRAAMTSGGALFRGGGAAPPAVIPIRPSDAPGDSAPAIVRSRA
jgi:nitrate reductase gamma subunit